MAEIASNNSGGFSRYLEGSVATSGLPSDVTKVLTEEAYTAKATKAVWSPAAGKKFRLLGLVLASSGACIITVKDESTTVAVIPLLAAGPLTINFGSRGLLSAAAANKLNLEVSAEVKVTGTLYGTEE